MKILLIGSDSKWAIENHYLKGLKQFAEVDFFNAHGLFLKHYHNSLVNKLKYRLGLSRYLHKLNRDLIEKVFSNNYQVLFVFKGMELFPETLKTIKSKGIYLVNYNPDHPFNFFSSGSGNKNVKRGILHYDHHFSYSKQIVEALENKYGTSASWLPFAYANSKKPEIEFEKYNRICFIGNPDSERAKKIQSFITAKIPIDVYGSGWDKYIAKSPYLNIHSAVYSEDFVKVAQSYRIQLNIFRPHNLDSHNMRSFEMPALGCIMLAPKSQEHEAFFENEKEAFYFNGQKEMLNLTKRILNLSKDQAFEIKINAFQRSINSAYHYDNRVETVAQFLKEKVDESR